jgi:H+/Cl- antiporter ClcA
MAWSRRANQARIAPRAALAKPLSAAIAIGTGGPFGAEGPIIVTGGALGSLLGQVLHVSPAERKILLACGAAAGMSATFGAPLASVVLAIELLLFEFAWDLVGWCVAWLVHFS